MRSLVIYASRYGNTQRIAEAIADALHARGEVELLPADEAPAVTPEGIDLIVIGGPTEGHRMTPPLVQLFAGMPRGSLRGKAAAAFDTRIQIARWLSGSAAVGISRKLRRLGARMIAPEESFFVAWRADHAKDEAPELLAGELARARVWAASLADTGTIPAPTATREAI